MIRAGACGSRLTFRAASRWRSLKRSLGWILRRSRAGDGEGPVGWMGKLRKRTQPSDRFKLLQQEAARKVTREQSLPRPTQPTLPDTEV